MLEYCREKIMIKISKEVEGYVECNILPVYRNFDKAHNENHIKDVQSRSLKILEGLKRNDINVEMVYVIASYHDIGCKISRKGHHIYSGQILREDEKLKEWFSDEQIEIMAQACEDHSTSSGHAPRSIYGQIVSDADKDLDLKIFLLRGWHYSLHYKPELTYEEHITDLHNEIIKRFGDESEGGKNLAKFYIKTKENIEFVKLVKAYVKSREKLIDMMALILNEEG